jgi:hypothetical protein
VDLRIAVVHVHKTGGTTLSSVFKRSFGGRHCSVVSTNPGAPFFDAAQLREMRPWYPRLHSIMGHDVKVYGDLDSVAPNLRYVTFLRDPVVRCASHYQYDVQVGGVDLPFEEWITHEVSPNRHTRHLAGPNATADEAIALLEKRFSFVGLIERYDESLVMMRRALEVRDVRYAKRWTAPADDIKRRLLEDPMSLELLRRANEDDLQVYRHVVDEIYPRQQAAHGPTLDDEVTGFREANAATTKWHMYARPRYAWYVAKWRFGYRPWAKRRRATRTAALEPAHR